MFVGEIGIGTGIVLVGILSFVVLIVLPIIGFLTISRGRITIRGVLLLFVFFSVEFALVVGVIRWYDRPSEEVKELIEQVEQFEHSQTVSDH